MKTISIIDRLRASTPNRQFWAWVVAGVLAVSALVSWRGTGQIERSEVNLESDVQALALYGTESGAEPILPIPETLPVNARKAVLGRRLFHDQRLSGDQSLSCASCHDLSTAGVDGRPYALGVNGRSNLRNVPTVYNAVFNFRQFWDGRAASLQEQALSPVTDPNEMAATWPQVIKRLSDDEFVTGEFKALYGGKLTPANVADAIAEFERTLITPNSPFDRYLKGDGKAISQDAKRGWELFRKVGCISCHQGVNVGGNMFQKFGVFEDTQELSHPDGKEEDPGRFKVTGREEDRHVFKVPSLRNVALTAPYFEGGEAKTLLEAVQTMARVQVGTELNREEARLLVAFLESLTALPAMESRK